MGPPIYGHRAGSQYSLDWTGLLDWTLTSIFFTLVAHIREVNSEVIGNCWIACALLV